jgi:hypothetical protein
MKQWRGRVGWLTSGKTMLQIELPERCRGPVMRTPPGARPLVGNVPAERDGRQSIVSSRNRDGLGLVLSSLELGLRLGKTARLAAGALSHRGSPSPGICSALDRE